MKFEHIVYLNLSACKYLGELHQRIKEAFDFPDYYGENWDAFYDLLCTDSTADKIIITGKDSASQSLQGEIEKMLDVIRDVQKHHEKYNIVLAVEVVDEQGAKNGESDT